MLDLEFAFEYKNFYIEGIPFDQTENGHPEDGITFTSYVWFTKEVYDKNDDYIDVLCEVYDSPKELKKGVFKLIDKYIKNHKLKR